MSGLVERLTQRWLDDGGVEEMPSDPRNEARWWLNAIADELEGANTLKLRDRELLDEIVDWLRSQATEGDET